MVKLQPVIGLEIHVELETKSKMFCQCEAFYFTKVPNSQVCPVCLGMPGALPVPNRKAIEWTMLLGQALEGTLNQYSKFDRKHYYYPDLPKGYQISQYDMPFAVNGHMTIDNKKFRIKRVHLEEDTGKLIHAEKKTLIDFNRAGVPLVEVVTEPDFKNADEVKSFLRELQIIIRYLEISSADMEKGSMRLEPNISLRMEGESTLPNYKVEVKNINSFNFVSKAIDFEIQRQAELLKKGLKPEQETRGFDEKKGVTFSQRTKEEAHDYRYFPEPDIPPFRFTEEYFRILKKKLPELPHKKRERYVKEFRIRDRDAFILTRNKRTANFFEEVMTYVNQKKLSIQNPGQTIANLLINKKIPSDITPSEFAKKTLETLAPKESDSSMIESAITNVIKKQKTAVLDYKNGKENAIMFLVGQVMKEIKGQADPQDVKKELINKLKI